MSHRGRTLRSTEVEGFRVFEVLYRAGTRLPRHCHAVPGLTAVIAGEMREHGECASTVGRPGEVFVRGAGRHHENGFLDSDTTCVVVEPPPRRWAVLAHLLPPGDALRIESAAARRTPFRLLGELRGERSSSRLTLEVAILELLAAVEGDLRRAGGAALVRAATELIAERPEMSQQEAAELLGTTPAELERAFRDNAPLPLSRFRLQQRIERARELLAASRLPLATVALEAGFCDQAHLTNAFRRACGVTPAAYRRAHRG